MACVGVLGDKRSIGTCLWSNKDTLSLSVSEIFVGRKIDDRGWSMYAAWITDVSLKRMWFYYWIGEPTACSLCIDDA